MIYYKFLRPESIYYFCEIDYVFKTEQWKNVFKYDGFYKVSDLGRVKSLRFRKEKILKFGSGTNEYFTVELWLNGVGKTRKVHQLAAESFLNHDRNKTGLVVNHIDLNKLNNNLYNLELITQRKNTNKRHLISSSQYTGVHKHRNKWRSTIVIKSKTVHLGCFSNEYDAHLAYENKLSTLL